MVTVSARCPSWCADQLPVRHLHVSAVTTVRPDHILVRLVQDDDNPTCGGPEIQVIVPMGTWLQLPPGLARRWAEVFAHLSHPELAASVSRLAGLAEAQLAVSN